MDINLDSFQKKLDDLKKQRFQVEFRLQKDTEQAEALKDKMKSLGYSSLDEMKADFVKKRKDLVDLESKLDIILEQIKSVPFKQPSKSEILSKLFDSSVDTDVSANNPSDSLNGGVVISSEIEGADISSEKIDNIPRGTDVDMFTNIQNLI